MDRHDQNVRKLNDEMYQLRPYSKQVLFSEIPPPLKIPSLTTSDANTWNLRGDLIEDVGNPILFSERQYRESERAGTYAKRLPKGSFAYNQKYLLDSTIGDRLILLKQGEELPVQSTHRMFTDVIDKSKIRMNDFSTFMLNSRSRAFNREDVGILNQIHVPTDNTRCRPPLISPDLHSVKVQKGPGSVRKINIGEYVENRPRVESELVPDSLLSQERQDIYRRRDLADENVGRIVALRKKMIAYRQQKQ